MPGRPRRRAVGPPGARPPEPVTAPPLEPSGHREDRGDDSGDDERLLADRPPHHDRGV